MKKKVIILSSVLFAIDLISKTILDNMLSLGKSITIFDRFFYITKAYNDGISFSMLKGHNILIIIFSILVMIFLYIYMQKFKINKRNIIAFGLVFGGLLGNLFDRIIYGYVIDFLDFYIAGYNYPIFNLADSFIFIGVLILIYSIWMKDDNEDNSK